MTKQSSYGMSDHERKVLEANIRLVDEKNDLLKDMRVLIAYIRGDKDLKEEVKNIIKYYKKSKYVKKLFK